MTLTFDCSALAKIARQAGAIIMEYYEADMNVGQKADNSPVTEADIAANDFIVEALQRIAPDIPVIAEEGGTDDHERPLDAQRFFLVDPLDGTKSFIRHGGEFTVNIALIEHENPVMGVVYVPAMGVLYTGCLKEKEAKKQEAGGVFIRIQTRKPPKDGMDVVFSRSHNTPETEAFLKHITVRHAVAASSSLKFCVVAEGKADIYPRFGTTMEWDTAAGHAVLLAAGGTVKTPEGKPFLYHKPGFVNGHFVAWGKRKAE